MHSSEFIADEIGMVRRIYDRFGLELRDEAEARMRRYAAYRERFGIASEPERWVGTYRACRGSGVDAARSATRSGRPGPIRVRTATHRGGAFAMARRTMSR